MQNDEGEWFWTDVRYCPDGYQVNHLCATAGEYWKDKFIGAGIIILFFLTIGACVAGYFFCFVKGDRSLDDFLRPPEGHGQTTNEHAQP